MKIITVCGSSKFKEGIMKTSIQMELSGNVLLVPIFPIKEEGNDFNEKDLKVLGDMHKERIKLSDAILVVNIDGYIGESTKNEIAFAKSLNKEIIYYGEVDWF